MKSRVIKSVIIPIFLLFSFISCKEYKITTTINEDGSILREVVFIGDSSYIFSSPFPIPLDTTWSISKVKERTDKSIYSALKLFNNSEELNQFYSEQDSTMIRIEIQTEKRFRWFYTYHRYKEVYYNFNSFKSKPIESYLTDEELENYMIGLVDEKLNDKIESWKEEMLFEEFYRRVRKIVIARNIAELPLSLFDSKKEEMHEGLLSSDSTDEIILKLKDILETDKVELIREDIEKIIDSVENKVELMMSAGGKYTNIVNLPGLLLETNANYIEGNIVKWEFDADRFIVTDLEMYAESRTVNNWAFIVTIAGAVIILMIILYPYIKKMSKNVPV
jgi:hypothetical protein